MTAFAAHLDALLARDDATAELVLVHARILLEDPATVAACVADAAGCLTEAAARFDALERETRGAFSKYPAVASGGFHSGDPDQRAYMLFATPGMVAKSGLYTPADLRPLVATGTVTQEWAGGEALRTIAFVAALRPLMAALDAKSLRPAEYPARCQALGREFAAIPLARARAAV